MFSLTFNGNEYLSRSLTRAGTIPRLKASLVAILRYPGCHHSSIDSHHRISIVIGVEEGFRMFWRQIIKLVGVLLTAGAVFSAHADWTTDPSVNTPICTAAHDQIMLVSVSDGAGGAIMAWVDDRSSWRGDIYAQRVDRNGDVLWTVGGIGVCTAAGAQFNPFMVSDGLGGVIISWSDGRNGATGDDIYAQRIDQNGDVLWSVDGIGVCTAVGDQQQPAMVSDGLGGAIIDWVDGRFSVVKPDIYAQRVDGFGSA